MSEVIENSFFYTFIRRVFSGSRTMELACSLWQGTGRVLGGSRFIGFFKVNDYLDIDCSPLRSVYQKARTVRALSAPGERARDLAGRVWAVLFQRESLFSKILDRACFFRKPGFSRKSMLIMVLAFLAGSLGTRPVVVRLVPGAEFLSPWSAVLCLGLLLILVLFALEGRPSGRDAEKTKEVGLLQRLALVLCWFPGKITPLARHLKVVCRKIIFGPTSPVEGGDV